MVGIQNIKTQKHIKLRVVSLKWTFDFEAAHIKQDYNVCVIFLHNFVVAENKTI